MNFEKAMTAWCPWLITQFKAADWEGELTYLRQAGVEATPFTTPIIGEFLLSRSAYAAALQDHHAAGMRLASERLVSAALAVDELIQSRRSRRAQFAGIPPLEEE